MNTCHDAVKQQDAYHSYPGLILVDSTASPLGVAGHQLTLNSLCCLSNPLNPLECFVQLLGSVESENTAANSAVL